MAILSKHGNPTSSCSFATMVLDVILIITPNRGKEARAEELMSQQIELTKKDEPGLLINRCYKRADLNDHTEFVVFQRFVIFTCCIFMLLNTTSCALAEADESPGTRTRKLTMPTSILSTIRVSRRRLKLMRSWQSLWFTWNWNPCNLDLSVNHWR